MGREIRMVPPNWEHPTKLDRLGRTQDVQMYDRTFEDSFAEWLSDFDRVRAGDLEGYEVECYPNGLIDWIQDEGAPLDPEFYRPWKDCEGTWYQVWQTVGEGSPVSPPFETKAELVDYLTENGDFWDQSRGNRPSSREAYESFVEMGFAMSGLMVDGRFYNGIDGNLAMQKDQPIEHKQEQ